MIDKAFELYNSGNVKEAANEILDSLEKNEDLQGQQINLARILLLAGNWGIITALHKPRTNGLIETGWLQSLLSSRPVNAEKEPIPWFTYSAIDFLENILCESWNIFEWGSGNSTKWWAKKVNSVTAIEDDQEWYAEVIPSLPDNAHVHYKEGKDYVDCIHEYPNQSFDVIILDGSQRNEAARACVEKLTDDGIIIFDNSDMQAHDDGQIFLEDNGFTRLDFWGLIPSYLYKNCTSVFFRNIESIKPKSIPSKLVSSVGKSCAQAVDNP